MRNLNLLVSVAVAAAATKFYILLLPFQGDDIQFNVLETVEGRND